MMKGKKSIGVRVTEGLLRFHGRLPLKYHYGWARIIAWLAGRVFRYRRDVVMVNLSRSFPEKKYEELEGIANRFYRHFANTLVEMVWFGACRGPKGRKRLRNSHLVEVTNAPEYNRLAAGARQVMILQAHTGNWELFGGMQEYCYQEPIDMQPDAIGVTYLQLRSKLWDRVMADNRAAPVADLGFDGYLETDSILRFALSNRDRKFCYSFITDQYPYARNHSQEEIEFLHRKTVSMNGAAALACKLDMAVAYLRFECREEGGYRISFVPICEHAGGKKPLDIMQQFFQLLEADIQAQPWNYLWTHKRWK